MKDYLKRRKAVKRTIAERFGLTINQLSWVNGRLWWISYIDGVLFKTPYLMKTLAIPKPYKTSQVLTTNKGGGR